MSFQLDTPILFLVFNRPKSTQILLEKIRSVRPKKLLVVADGPRVGHPTDTQNCIVTRELLDTIDWPCEVIKEFSATNLGCKKRVSTGLDWAFNQEEELIILEDDCLPTDSFFQYCQEMLSRYRTDENVMMISGSNLLPEQSLEIPYSYSFSRWAQIWGWATWRRAWKRYDVNLSDWPKYRESDQFKRTMGTWGTSHYWKRIFDHTYAGQVDTWDHQWSYAMLRHEGLSIQPQKNLVTNIGFGADATHTKTANGFELLPARELDFPLIHPPGLWVHEASDRMLQQKKQSVVRRVATRLKSFLSDGMQDSQK